MKRRLRRIAAFLAVLYAAAGDRGRFVPLPGATHVSVFHAAFADPGTAAILRAFLAPHAEEKPHAESAE